MLAASERCLLRSGNHRTLTPSQLLNSSIGLFGFAVGHLVKQRDAVGLGHRPTFPASVKVESSTSNNCLPLKDSLKREALMPARNHPGRLATFN